MVHGNANMTYGGPCGNEMCETSLEGYQTVSLCFIKSQKQDCGKIDYVADCPEGMNQIHCILIREKS